MSKNINTDPINFKPFLLFFYKQIKKYSVFLVIVFMFLGFYLSTDYVFSNDYILNSLIQKRIYSRKCLVLHNTDKDLVVKLDDFYNNLKVGNSVAPVFFYNIPKSLGNHYDVDEKKRVFLNIVLPIVLRVEKDTLKERSRLLAISTKVVNEPLLEEDFNYISKIASKYKITIKGDSFWDYVDVLDILLKRVDVIPRSLVLAIAAKETGWGQSRFLHQANSLFSEWAWSDKDGIAPLKRKSDHSNVIKKFDHLEESVRSFYRNINTHTAYKPFREARKKMRAYNPYGKLDAVYLSGSLTKYSTNQAYVSEIQRLIKENALEKFSNREDFSDKYNVTCLRVN